MHFEEYRKYDGLGLAQPIAAGEITGAECLAVARARSEKVNPLLNAIVVPMDDVALARARCLLSGPFAGVPFLSKNLEQQYAGILSANGCRALKESSLRPTDHAEITRRWLQSGIVIFGQTNTPEFGLMPVTEPRAFGPSRNPWDVSLSPGGSSGGSAAAVAAGIVPMAGGNDVGGSIRIPASMCGLFGFKPGRGRTPWGPDHGEVMHGAAVHHVLTRSVRDSAAMLDASHGSEMCASFLLAPPARPYQQELTRDPGRLRIAFSVASPLGTDISPEAVIAVQNAAELLEHLGHEVEADSPAIDWPQFFTDVMTMMYANAAFFVTRTQKETGCSKHGFEPDTLVMARFGRAIRADEYVASLARWEDYRRVTNSFLARHDVFMTPTVAFPPPAIGANATPRYEYGLVDLLQSCGLSRRLLGSARLKDKVISTLQRVPFTELANLTGTPAMSVPLHWSADGLPVGVHFMAGPAKEDVLFRLASQLEKAQPWFGKVPAL
jgi:amidase